MQAQPNRSFQSVLFLFIALPLQGFAQTNHVVTVGDNFFDPAEITIEVGDTVRWENPAGGNFHNVVADDMSFSSGTPATSFSFQHTFTEAGVNGYVCQPHAASGMTGTVIVTGGSSGSGVDINPGHNGNWWNGLARDGEGAQVEVSDAGNDELVFVTTIYSYSPGGSQIFLIAVGTPIGETVEVEIFISEGGAWGDAFDPENVEMPTWGTGVFTSGGCDLLSMVLTPNATYQDLGYTELAYDLERLTTPIIPCPYEE